MEKRIFLRDKKFRTFLFIIIFCINLVSASYECSNGSLIEDQDEIDIGDTEAINGLRLGLVYSDETPVFNTYSAELIFDARKFLLSDETNSTEVDLKSGDYVINLTNLTDTNAIIDVDGDIESLEIGDTKDVKGLKVFLYSMEGSYPGVGSISGIIGKDKISLTNEDSAAIITVDEVDYVLELFSASDTNAIIKVKKCDQGELVEIEDPVTEDIIIENSSISNETENNESEINQTQINESEQQDVNQTSGLVNQTQESNETSGLKEDENSNFEKFFYYGTIFVIAIIILILLIVLIVFLKNRTNQEKNTT